jgi:hypothetical protein
MFTGVHLAMGNLKSVKRVAVIEVNGPSPLSGFDSVLSRVAAVCQPDKKPMRQYIVVKGVGCQIGWSRSRCGEQIGPRIRPDRLVIGATVNRPARALVKEFSDLRERLLIDEDHLGRLRKV